MKYFSLTDIGKKRENNEDSFFSFTNMYADVQVGVFAVADGMGGYENGQYASKTAVEIVKEYIQTNFSNIDFEQLKDDYIRKISTEAIKNANDYIFEKSKENPMGTTFVMVIEIGEKLYAINVGDSRAYILNKDNFIQITKDNSYVQYLVEQGLINASEARTHSQKNKITRAVGFESDVEIDFYVRELEKLDKVLICSDGLTAMIEDEKIKEVLQYDKNLEDICKSLIELANRNGGIDNITITVIENN
ncbi:MAG: Stp1/IreP family PP2C-type Ser/Thr phosphatase [Peptostreptococcaceae bacterium]|nr:Stp1/IreP family PP2C-type Ser/Thr phosphatase [Peptostreptococcaceae bacterium]